MIGSESPQEPTAAGAQHPFQPVPYRPSGAAESNTMPWQVISAAVLLAISALLGVERSLATLFFSAGIDIGYWLETPAVTAIVLLSLLILACLPLLRTRPASMQGMMTGAAVINALLIAWILVEDVLPLLLRAQIGYILPVALRLTIWIALPIAAFVLLSRPGARPSPGRFPPHTTSAPTAATVAASAASTVATHPGEPARSPGELTATPSGVVLAQLLLLAGAGLFLVSSWPRLSIAFTGSAYSNGVPGVLQALSTIVPAAIVVAASVVGAMLLQRRFRWARVAIVAAAAWVTAEGLVYAWGVVDYILAGGEARYLPQPVSLTLGSAYLAVVVAAAALLSRPARERCDR